MQWTKIDLGWIKVVLSAEQDKKIGFAVDGNWRV